MSFYDSASLVFLPSGGAGKDGKAYSIKPVPEYGNELITNGGFDTDSDWTKTNATISNGKATINVINGAFSYISQTSFNYTDGNNYVLTATIQGASGSSGKQIKFQDEGSNTGGLTISNGSITLDESIQNVQIYWTANANSNGIFISRQSASGTYSFSIDNVSVKEVIVDGDFTFSRGINLTATRVDSNGLIEKGRENLLKQSNQFDTTWVGTSGVSVTDGQSGYDGTNDAWLLSKSVTEQYSRVQQTIPSVSGVYTCSVYAKENTLSIMGLRNGSSADRVLFDLSGSGSIDSQVGNIVYKKIESVGNGWFRCQVVFSDPLDQFQIYVDWSEADAGSIYIQDAQLEIGLVATEYIESGASTGLAGLLEDSPRFDYSGGASCPSLLLEPSRTQLAKLSEYFEGWSDLSNITPTTNYTTSPEGLQNATRLQFTSNGYIYNSGAPTQVSGTEYTLTLYAKRNDSGTQSFGFFTNGSGSVDSAMALTSEWQRFTYTYTASNNSQLGLAGLSGADVSVYGFQVEQGSYPTSYIPNHSGGSVTRGADSCNGAGDASTFNDSEGVLYAEIAALTDDQSSRTITLTDGTFDERIQLSYYTGGSNQIRVFIKSGGTFSAVITTTLTDITEFNKIAYRYKSGETKLFINGSLIGTSADTFSITGLNVLQFANGDGLSNPLQGKAKQVIVFNTALSNTDLEILTGTSYESFAAMATALNYTTYE